MLSSRRNAVPRFVLISAVDVVPLDVFLARIASAPERVVVLVRDKALSRAERVEIAERVLEVARPRGDSVWISESAELAKELSLDGVHLGGAPDAQRILAARRTSGDATWINVACHSVEEVRRAASFVGAAAPDSLFLSPIFASPGKGDPLGLAALAHARGALASLSLEIRRPPDLIALGGIDEARAEACFRAGADAVASIQRAPFGSPGSEVKAAP